MLCDALFEGGQVTVERLHVVVSFTCFVCHSPLVRGRRSRGLFILSWSGCEWRKGEMMVLNSSARLSLVSSRNGSQLLSCFFPCFSHLPVPGIGRSERDGGWCVALRDLGVSCLLGGLRRTPQNWLAWGWLGL